MEKPHQRLRLVIAALCVVGVLLACSTPTTVRLSMAPADKLALTLNFTHLLTPSTQVIVDAVLKSTSGNPVELTGKQHLTLNGRNEDASPVGVLGHSASRFTVPRAPAGGSYTVVYTDERGQQTSVVVPVPQRDLTIISPAAHAQLAIPQPGGHIAVQYAVPSLFPATSPLSRPPSTQVDAGAGGHCRVARSDGTPTSAPNCSNASSSQPGEPDSVIISDTGELPDYGFGNLAPGPGDLYVVVTVNAMLPSTGFASVDLSAFGVATIPITWI